MFRAANPAFWPYLVDLPPLCRDPLLPLLVQVLLTLLHVLLRGVSQRVVKLIVAFIHHVPVPVSLLGRERCSTEFCPSPSRWPQAPGPCQTHPLVVLPLLPLLLRLKGNALLPFCAPPWGEPESPGCSQGNLNSVPQERGFHTAQPGQLSPDCSPLPRDRRGVAPRCLRSSAHSLYLYDGVGNGVLSEYRLLTDLKHSRWQGLVPSQSLLTHTEPPLQPHSPEHSLRPQYLSRSRRSVSRSDGSRWPRSESL